jgi:2-polyprenyl-3-methyl-5-hydroxy-6-metoxy-1,4-benzoquinol methylase
MRNETDNTLTAATDKAGEEYWTKFWQNFPLPPAINIRSSNINEYPNKILHKLFSEILKDTDCKGKKILEIGCGNSVFLTYFKKEFGFDVYGLDYSELGCKQTEKIFERDGITGKVFLADAFNPPTELFNSFDVVCSFGVVEHFEDTSGTLKAFAGFLKPGGILITSIPNFTGATGLLHKWLNRPVYDVHVPLSKEQLIEGASKAGLKTELARYFLAISFAITLEGHDGKKIPNYRLKKFFVKTIRYASKLIWILESVFGTLPPGKFFSGGIISAAKKI